MWKNFEWTIVCSYLYDDMKWMMHGLRCSPYYYRQENHPTNCGIKSHNERFTGVPKMKRFLKVKVFKKMCSSLSHLPFLLSVSRPKMSVGASCWNAGAMCSLRPLMSWPLFTSFAIFWASLSCLVRGLSPVAITLNENTSLFLTWSGWCWARCWAMEFFWSLALICFSWHSIRACAENPVSPLYLISQILQTPV